MAKDKKAFMLYADQKGLFDKLPNEKAGELIKHIFSYVNDEDPKTDDLIIQLGFEPIKQQLKRDLQKYYNICERNRENGLKGGRPKNQKEPKKPSGLLGNPKKPKKPDTDTDTDKDNDTEKDKDKDNSVVVKKLVKWLSGKEGVDSPVGLAHFYRTKFSDEVISAALKDPSCITRGKFSEICKYLSEKKRLNKTYSESK